MNLSSENQSNENRPQIRISQPDKEAFDKLCNMLSGQNSQIDKKQNYSSSSSSSFSFFSDLKKKTNPSTSNEKHTSEIWMLPPSKKWESPPVGSFNLSSFFDDFFNNLF